MKELNEQQLYINVLELLAAFSGLQAFVKTSDTHVKILSDNTMTQSNTCHKIIYDI